MRMEVAAPDDAPAIVALMNRAYRGSGAAAGWTTEAGYIEGSRTTEAVVREDMAANPDGAFLVARSGDEDGLDGAVWVAPKGEGIWYLGSLTVDPALQNAGAGRRLLAAAEDWAQARGARAIDLTVVHLRDSLIAWYQRRGYRLTGKVEPFPYGDDRFGRPRRDDLYFVVMEKVLASD